MKTRQYQEECWGREKTFFENLRAVCESVSSFDIKLWEATLTQSPRRRARLEFSAQNTGCGHEVSTKPVPEQPSNTAMKTHQPATR